MKLTTRILNIALIVLFVSLAVVGTAYAQNTGGNELLSPFTPVLAAAASIERLLQLIRHIVSPDPNKGLLARGTLALRYFTTIGGAVLGLLIAFISRQQLLLAAGVTVPPVIDVILTGIVIGLGSEFVHQVIQGLGDGKQALRAVSDGGKSAETATTGNP